MPSKRTLENDLDDVADAVLTDLSPADRVRLIVEAAADDDDDRVERLVETCPTATYERPIHEYTNRARSLLIIAQDAAYQLRTTWLEFNWLQTAATKWLIHDLFLAPDNDLEFEGEPPPAFADPEDHIDRFETQAAERVFELYVLYHSYQLFAEEELGTDLATLLAFGHRDEVALAAIEETLDLHEPTVERVADDLITDAPDDLADDTEIPLEVLVANTAQGLTETWETADDPTAW